MAGRTAGMSKKKVVVTIMATVSAAVVVAILVGVMTGKNVLNQGSDYQDRANVNPLSGKDTTKPRSIVPLDQIVSGGPPRDGIPSIDKPRFVSVPEAGKFLQDSDIVLGLDINGDIRAYPLQILVWHEIVNDKVGGVPVAVTYCPLCFTNQVFNRMVDGQTLEFGTSGKLYNNNLVMYDRASESLWSQALGEGIVGKYAGTKLERIPFDLAYWREWKGLYPDAKVLSADTGFGRPYGADPYGDYYTSPSIYFPISNHDSRLGPKEIVIGLEHDGVYRAYQLSKIEEEHVINDDLAGRPVLIASHYQFMTRVFERTVDDQVLEFEYKDGVMTDRQTGSVWGFDGVATDGEMTGKRLQRLPLDQGFWFAWAAFHPGTELY
ncbi:DUF3179 domain-containing protein [Candidatus Nitrososphaera gargensis]|nr:DUF3179 domain-containing protein [Candidatus Nitrososphaera gargensis]